VDEALAVEEADQVFLRSDSAARKAAWLSAGGGVALAFAALGFVAALFARVDQFSLQVMTTLPALLGVGCVAAGWSIARTPTQVTVGPQGVTIEGKKGISSYTWQDIGWSTVSGQTPFYGRKLVLFSPQGKTLAKIGDGFENFESLRELVAEHIARKRGETAQKVQAGRLKKTAVLAGFMGFAMIAIGLGLAWDARSKQRAARDLKERGILGKAEIVRRFIAPNGVTTRLEYRITTSDGKSGTRNAELNRLYWNTLEGATQVPVVYVPDDPENSRVAFGEVIERDIIDDPSKAYLICALGGAMGVFLFVMAILSWLGWDFSQDPKTGKLSIKRVRVNTNQT
jgi:hypothetical protein